MLADALMHLQQRARWESIRDPEVFSQQYLQRVESCSMPSRDARSCDRFFLDFAAIFGLPIGCQSKTTPAVRSIHMLNRNRFRKILQCYDRIHGLNCFHCVTSTQSGATKTSVNIIDEIHS